MFYVLHIGLLKNKLCQDRIENKIRTQYDNIFHTVFHSQSSRICIVLVVEQFQVKILRRKYIYTIDNAHFAFYFFQ